MKKKFGWMREEKNQWTSFIRQMLQRCAENKEKLSVTILCRK